HQSRVADKGRAVQHREVDERRGPQLDEQGRARAGHPRPSMNDARRRLRAVGNSSPLAPSPTYRVDGSSRATPVAKGGRMSNVRSATRAGRRLGMYSAAVSAALLVTSAGVSAAPMTFRAALVPETAEYQTGSGEVIVVYDDVNHML